MTTRKRLTEIVLFSSLAIICSGLALTLADREFALAVCWQAVALAATTFVGFVCRELAQREPSAVERARDVQLAAALGAINSRLKDLHQLADQRNWRDAATVDAIMKATRR